MDWKFDINSCNGRYISKLKSEHLRGSSIGYLQFMKERRLILGSHFFNDTCWNAYENWTIWVNVWKQGLNMMWSIQYSVYRKKLCKKTQSTTNFRTLSSTSLYNYILFAFWTNNVAKKLRNLLEYGSSTGTSQNNKGFMNIKKA